MKPQYSPLRFASGFSLLELMISIVLGLLILAGVLSIFLGSQRGFRTQESVGQVQEGGRFLGYVFYPHVRLAGHLSDPLLQRDVRTIFPRSNGEAGGTPAETEPNANVDVRRALWGLNDVGAAANAAGVTSRAGTDVIVTRYLGKDTVNTTATDTVLRPCQFRAAGLGANEMAENVFFVTAAENGLSSLSCRAQILNATTAAVIWGPVSQPLINGVQNMQVLYGIDPDINGIPDGYVSANLVTDWQQVATVRITTTVDSAEQTEGANVDPGAGGVTSRRVRRIFTGTVQIRNRLGT